MVHHSASLRAGELVRHQLVEILQREDLQDPALKGVSVTISEVRTSPDLRHADIYCLPLGDTGDVDHADAVVAGLNRSAAHIRGFLGRRLEMKFTPALRFHRDRSFEEASRIDQLLAEPKVMSDVANADDDPQER